MEIETNPRRRQTKMTEYLFQLTYVRHRVFLLTIRMFSAAGLQGVRQRTLAAAEIILHAVQPQPSD
jgi:hypothetical protein